MNYLIFIKIGIAIQRYDCNDSLPHFSMMDRLYFPTPEFFCFVHGVASLTAADSVEMSNHHMFGKTLAKSHFEHRIQFLILHTGGVGKTFPSSVLLQKCLNVRTKTTISMSVQSITAITVSHTIYFVRKLLYT